MCERLADIPIPNFLKAPNCCACGSELTGLVHVIALHGKVAVVCPGCRNEPIRTTIDFNPPAGVGGG